MSLFRKVDSDGDDTIWMDTGDPLRPVAILARYQLDSGVFDLEARKAGADELWALLVEQIPARGES